MLMLRCVDFFANEQGDYVEDFTYVCGNRMCVCVCVIVDCLRSFLLRWSDGKLLA